MSCVILIVTLLRYLGTLNGPPSQESRPHPGFIDLTKDEGISNLLRWATTGSATAPDSKRKRALSAHSLTVSNYKTTPIQMLDEAELDDDGDRRSLLKLGKHLLGSMLSEFYDSDGEKAPQKGFIASMHDAVSEVSKVLHIFYNCCPRNRFYNNAKLI